MTIEQAMNLDDKSPITQEWLADLGWNVPHEWNSSSIGIDSKSSLSIEPGDDGYEVHLNDEYGHDGVMILRTRRDFLDMCRLCSAPIIIAGEECYL